MTETVIPRLWEGVGADGPDEFWDRAVEVAAPGAEPDAIRRAAPRRAYLTHMNHDLGHAATNARLPEPVQLAYDGLVLDVGVDVE